LSYSLNLTSSRISADARKQNLEVAINEDIRLPVTFHNTSRFAGATSAMQFSKNRHRTRGRP